jgi:hypothetical protein
LPSGSVICVMRPCASRANGTLRPPLLLVMPVELKVSTLPLRSLIDSIFPAAVIV